MKIQIIILLHLLLILNSCNSDKYYYEVTYLSGKVDTIITDNNYLKIKHNKIISLCTNQIYASQVREAKRIEINTIKHKCLLEKLIKVYYLITLIIAIILLIFYKRKLIKSKIRTTNKSFIIMNKILKYIIYGGGIIITFKIILLLIKYLPSIIEQYLKTN